ncbi:MAG: hypothetical protein IKA46_02860 [Clostridia bacterium]|nr:hypothetical protein [Clostridia bacterium]MBR3862727.1 hypothetical protein [Clostridia bacterium]
MENEILENELPDEPEEEIGDEELEEIELDEPEKEPHSEGDAEEMENFEDFEYDENGDIVIPEEEQDGEEDPAGEEPAAQGEEQPPQDTPKPPAEDEEKAALRRELAQLRSQARDTLSKMGVAEQDPVKGLAKLAAEAAGVPEEEYLKKQREEAELEAARARVKRERFEARMQRDLAEIHAAYPETKMYKSPEEFPNFKRFGELMDKGNTPTEAYIASHPDARANAVAAAARQHDLNDTKKHLRSNVPTGTNSKTVTMPRSVLREWRELFPNKSDRELAALYKKTL